jgi:hypothetical protein
MRRMSGVLTRLGIELHPAKTRMGYLSRGREGFHFFGYHLRKRMSGRGPGSLPTVRESFGTRAGMMPRPARPPVGHVREVRMHGLNGGLASTQLAPLAWRTVGPASAHLPDHSRGCIARVDPCDASEDCVRPDFSQPRSGRLVRGEHRRQRRVYTAPMSARLADVTGTVTTIMAGVLLAALSVSAFGATPALVGSLALFLFAIATTHAMSRHRSQ